jgi:2-hydroxyglutarate dehydrogenase
VVVIEAAANTSSRNSEVIYASLHYPKGSLKSRFYVRGRQLLYDFALIHGVGDQRLGKLIVATDKGQIQRLREIKATARANGVNDVALIDGTEALRMEPACRLPRTWFRRRPDRT